VYQFTDDLNMISTNELFIRLVNWMFRIKNSSKRKVQLFLHCWRFGLCQRRKRQQRKNNWLFWWIFNMTLRWSQNNDQTYDNLRIKFVSFVFFSAQTKIPQCTQQTLKHRKQVEQKSSVRLHSNADHVLTADTVCLTTELLRDSFFTFPTAFVVAATLKLIY